MPPFLLEKDEGSVANESREGERGANESSKSFVAPVVPWNFLPVLLSVSLAFVFVTFGLCFLGRPYSTNVMHREQHKAG